LGLLESIRKWIDGEATEDLLEAADEHARPRRRLGRIPRQDAREVEAVMQQEMFTPPGGPLYPRANISSISALKMIRIGRATSAAAGAGTISCAL